MPSRLFRILSFLGFWALFAPPVSAQTPPPPTIEKAALKKVRDPAKLNVPQRSVYLSAQRGMEWLHKTNRPDGRFVYGFLPALRAQMEGDDYLHQAGAAFALARAARFFDDERAGAIARQAVLTLLLETTDDPKEKHLRYTAAPSHLLNRPAATSLLVLAIHDLPNPAKDLLDQADQMTNYLRTLLNADGSVRVEDAPADPKAARSSESADEATQHYSGLVLYAILRSNQLRPAAWKLEAVRKACPYYHGYWQRNKNFPMVAWHTAVCSEAYQATREKDFAEFTFALNDWLSEHQYTKHVARRGHWRGGFMSWRDGKMLSLPPDVRGAEGAISLAEACRVAQVCGDLPRLARYQKGAESALVFLSSLQYTDASTQHFAEWFRPALVGGFHASHQDGNLRIDFTQNALLAQIHYLANLVDW